MRTTVLFLGTGGARFVVARQLRASGGMWMRFGQTQIHVDPGPGALVRALSMVPPCVPAQLSALILSHKHLDHSNDINIMIEAMTHGGFHKRGMLLAPADALEGEHVVFPYALRFVEKVERLKPSAGPYRIGQVELRTSLKHVHAVETYGLHFTYNGSTISYMPCGRFFDGLIEDYALHEPDVLIVNVLRYRDRMDVDHLTFDDVVRILEGVRPKVAVLSHFGTKMLERNPDQLAEELEHSSGRRVIAARDGYRLDVDIEVAAAAH
ncbi:MAG: MBL fold metallo-hydrolase [Candidatus Eremiobacteraeota bacterium]|nr:MBL fold metallo-hydrolase [Candidatus Eremiobacteraeota bacterium]MBV9276827.1 MBL fold metallo-hydrolase [Candidatus Eremiobacteraeota bacterium]